MASYWYISSYDHRLTEHAWLTHDSWLSAHSRLRALGPRLTHEYLLTHDVCSLLIHDSAYNSRLAHDSRFSGNSHPNLCPFPDSIAFTPQSSRCSVGCPLAALFTRDLLHIPLPDGCPVHWRLSCFRPRVTCLVLAVAEPGEGGGGTWMTLHFLP